jgi:hypothetical protein
MGEESEALLCYAKWKEELFADFPLTAGLDFHGNRKRPDCVATGEGYPR